MTFSVNLNEGASFQEGTYTFGITPDSALTETTTIRWEIVPLGALPLSLSRIDNRSGTLNFVMGDTVGKSASFTATANDVINYEGHFQIRVYQVVDGMDDELVGSSETIVLENDVVIDIAIDPATFFPIDGSIAPNFFSVATSRGVELNGAGGNDVYIINKYHSGFAKISDTFGVNQVVFDSGVMITAITEVLDSRESIYAVKLILSTGGVVEVELPSGDDWQYRLGAGEALSYADFKRIVDVGAGYVVESRYVGDAPDAPSTIDLSVRGSENGDILSPDITGITNYENSGGDDIYIITRQQYGNVNIEDTLGSNIIKFDAGIEITSFTPNPNSIADVAITLATGAVITITSPNTSAYKYQLGDDVLLDYADFATKILTPTASAISLSVREENDQTLSLEHFNPTVATGLNAISAVRITALPAIAHGTLWLNNRALNNPDLATADGILVNHGQGNVLTFRPERDYVGPAAFDYQFKDSSAAFSEIATVTINVENKTDIASVAGTIAATTRFQGITITADFGGTGFPETADSAYTFTITAGAHLITRMAGTNEITATTSTTRQELLTYLNSDDGQLIYTLNGTHARGTTARLDDLTSGNTALTETIEPVLALFSGGTNSTTPLIYARVGASITITSAALSLRSPDNETLPSEVMLHSAPAGATILANVLTLNAAAGDHTVRYTLADPENPGQLYAGTQGTLHITTYETPNITVADTAFSGTLSERITTNNTNANATIGFDGAISYDATNRVIKIGAGNFTITNSLINGLPDGAYSFNGALFAAPNMAHTALVAYWNKATNTFHFTTIDAIENLNVAPTAIGYTIINSDLSQDFFIGSDLQVTEDSDMSASGLVNIAVSATLLQEGDVFIGVTNAMPDNITTRVVRRQSQEVNGTYGIFSVSRDDAGALSWSYALDNALAQSLNAATAATDTLWIKFNDQAVDGTAAIQVNIIGVDDAFTYTAHAGATLMAQEAGGNHAATDAHGSFTLGDVDSPDAVITLDAGTDSSNLNRLTFDVENMAFLPLPYGTITFTFINDRLTWQYEIDQTITAIDELNNGDTLTETIYLHGAADGGTPIEQILTLIINGASDAPVIDEVSGTIIDTPSPTDDFPDISGMFSISDVDDTSLSISSANALATTERAGFTHRIEGTYGNLYFHNTTFGYIYVVDDAAINAINASISEQDDFIIRATDAGGTYSDANFIIVVIGAEIADEPFVMLDNGLRYEGAAEQGFVAGFTPSVENGGGIEVISVTEYLISFDGSTPASLSGDGYTSITGLYSLEPTGAVSNPVFEFYLESRPEMTTTSAFFISANYTYAAPDGDTINDSTPYVRASFTYIGSTYEGTSENEVLNVQSAVRGSTKVIGFEGADTITLTASAGTDNIFYRFNSDIPGYAGTDGDDVITNFARAQDNLVLVDIASTTPDADLADLASAGAVDIELLLAADTATIEGVCIHFAQSSSTEDNTYLEVRFSSATQITIASITGLAAAVETNAQEEVHLTDLNLLDDIFGGVDNFAVSTLAASDYSFIQ